MFLNTTNLAAAAWKAEGYRDKPKVIKLIILADTFVRVPIYHTGRCQHLTDVNLQELTFMS